MPTHTRRIPEERCAITLILRSVLLLLQCARPHRGKDSFAKVRCLRRHGRIACPYSRTTLNGVRKQGDQSLARCPIINEVIV